MQTEIWINQDNGHHYATGEGGATLNGKPCDIAPAWASGRAPDLVFGDLQPWAGGECPVDPNAYVRCIFRGRRPYIGPALYPGFNDRDRAGMWQRAPFGRRNDLAMDIIAYQVRVA